MIPMCSAGGPMMLDSFCVDSDTYRCDDCGEEFTHEGKKKAACPKCKSRKVAHAYRVTD